MYYPTRKDAEKVLRTLKKNNQNDSFRINAFTLGNRLVWEVIQTNRFC